MFNIRLLSILSFIFILNSANSQSKQWDKKFGYFEYDLVVTNQLVDSQSNHYVMGTFKGVHNISGNIIATRGEADIYIIKYNPNNQIQWVKTFGSAARDNAISMSCDKTGNLFITGAFYGSTFYASSTDSLTSFTSYSQSRYILKINGAGSTQWAKKFSATLSVDDSKSEVLNDRDGRLYLIVTNRAAQTPTSWQYQDSVISNPTNNFINTPRWAMCRINENNGKLIWLNYIAYPLISGNFITTLNISSPKLDSRNNILFAITQWGNHIQPIYVFGEYTPVGNNRTNNILVRIDSTGRVTKFRDLGLNNTFTSGSTEIALTSDNNIALINKSAQGTDNGITYNYTNNPSGFNYLRMYDSNFVLQKIVKLGQQEIKNYLFDKRNRLITIGASSLANYNLPAVNETLQVDSSKSVTINTASQVFPYLIRYSNNFKLDSFYLENNSKPYFGGISGSISGLKIASNGDIYPTLSYPSMNNLVFRYDSSFKPKNSNYGKIRDREEQIISLTEDYNGNIYSTGVIQGKAIIQNSSGKDSIITPFENSSDCFVSKFDKNGNLLWIKIFGNTSQESGRFMTINKSGIYILYNSGPTFISSEWTLTGNKKVKGNQVIIKLDFDGNLLWCKGIYSLELNNVPGINIFKSLSNDDLLIGIKGKGDVYFGEEKFNSLGNKIGQIIGIINNEDGNIKKYNRFALRNENDGYIQSSIDNAYQDQHGNLYLAMQSLFTGNLNAPSSQNELYSFKQKTVSFSHVWQTQSSLLKLDSSLEISKFNQFISYMNISDITGISNSVYISGRARNNTFNYGDTTVPLFSYAQNKHFINFVGVLDTTLKIKNIAKMDTLTLETQVTAKKLFVDPITKDVYNTLQFNGSIAFRESLIKIKSNGGSDILFTKYDSSGNLIGGQQLGTPQNDGFITSFLDKSSNLIFSSTAVDPNYISRVFTQATPNNPPGIVKKYSAQKNNPSNTSYNIIGGAKPTGADAEGNIELPSGVSKDILEPDSYISKYVSLKEVGRGPDTSTIEVVNPIFCKGDSAKIIINEATSIQWKRNGTAIVGSNGTTIYPKESGSYYAVITTVEGRKDSSRAITILANELPSGLVVSNTNYCLGQASFALPATSNTGNELLWYTSASASNFTTIAPSPSTSSAGSIDYYISQRNTNSGCIGPKVKITAIINNNPAAPSVNDLAYCESATSISLAATASTNNSILWYGSNETGGTASIDTPTPSTSSVGTFNYYVSQKNNITSCESPRAKIIVTINAVPSAPVTTDVNLCLNSAATAITATAGNGNNILWYGSNETGGTAALTAPIPSTSTTGNVNYYVSQKVIATGCEGPRAKIIVTINALPSAPTTTNVNYCLNSVAPALKVTAANGISLLWYGNNSTGGTAILTAPIPSTTTAGIGDYYVSQKINATGCEGPRAKISVAITALPPAPSVSDVSYCIGSQANQLSATAVAGNNLLWHSSATGGVWVSTAFTPSTSSTGKTDFYVSQSTAPLGCEGPRSKITVTINPIPSSPNITRRNDSLISSSLIGNRWLKDGAELSNTTQSIKPLTAGSYFVKTTINGCTSPMSSAYLSLLTDYLNDEAAVKAAPNPFVNQLNIDFVYFNNQKVNVEIFDNINGTKVYTTQNLQPGTPIYLGNLMKGTYLIKITSQDNKIVKQFRVVKL
jgi:hypothetical protein